ncbi:hypothetical protein CF319_g4997 [Tilletia indica]|nr:hypothetical protein CF319_g4997 [Tilletia indica]
MSGPFSSISPNPPPSTQVPGGTQPQTNGAPQPNAQTILNDAGPVPMPAVCPEDTSASPAPGRGGNAAQPGFYRASPGHPEFPPPEHYPAQDTTLGALVVPQTQQPAGANNMRSSPGTAVPESTNGPTHMSGQAPFTPTPPSTAVGSDAAPTHNGTQGPFSLQRTASLYDRSMMSEREPEPNIQSSTDFTTTPTPTPSGNEVLKFTETDAAILLGLVPTFDMGGVPYPTVPGNDIMTRPPQHFGWTEELEWPTDMASRPIPPAPVTPRGFRAPYDEGQAGKRSPLGPARTRMRSQPPSPSPMRGDTSSLSAPVLVRPFTPRSRTTKSSASHAIRPARTSPLAARTKPFWELPTGRKGAALAHAVPRHPAPGLTSMKPAFPRFDATIPDYSPAVDLLIRFPDGIPLWDNDNDNANTRISDSDPQLQASLPSIQNIFGPRSNAIRVLSAMSVAVHYELCYVWRPGFDGPVRGVRLRSTATPYYVDPQRQRTWNEHTLDMEDKAGPPPSL